MLQIIQNYLLIFMIPFVVGVVLRLLIRKTRKPFILSVSAVVLAVIMWIVYAVVPTHGSEGYGIITLVFTTMALGTLISGLITRIWHKK